MLYKSGFIPCRKQNKQIRMTQEKRLNILSIAKKLLRLINGLLQIDLYYKYDLHANFIVMEMQLNIASTLAAVSESAQCTKHFRNTITIKICSMFILIGNSFLSEKKSLIYVWNRVKKFTFHMLCNTLFFMNFIHYKIWWQFESIASQQIGVNSWCASWFISSLLDMYVNTNSGQQFLPHPPPQYIENFYSKWWIVNGSDRKS